MHLHAIASSSCLVVSLSAYLRCFSQCTCTHASSALVSLPSDVRNAETQISLFVEEFLNTIERHQQVEVSLCLPHRIAGQTSAPDDFRFRSTEAQGKIQILTVGVGGKTEEPLVIRPEH